MAGAGMGYDRVLVDAECTHDGSIKHLSKFASWGWETFEKRFLEPSRLATLETLQRSLLRNGYARLRPGGRLIYSTCSFARRQNEDVVRWLLGEEPSARCVPLADLSADAPSRPGGLEHTVRFEPCSSRTSALFIARIERTAEGR
jgi:16S rRNA C967 or C1407 C5-methylase (RsmB/RsmF family)